MSNENLPPPVDADKPLAAFYDGGEVYIAHSVADAIAVAKALGYCEDAEFNEWEELDADAVRTIRFEDERGAVKKTIREWIASNGRGFLCTENY